MKAGVASVGGAVGEVRRKRPFVDHTIRAYGRYTKDGGDRCAASATYFAFLSFFPIMALVFSITGFVVDAYPDAEAKLTEQINDYLPGLADRLNVADIGRAKVGAGVIGIVGLLLAGLAWVSALREAIRVIWHQSLEAGNFVMRRVRDVGILAGLGLTLLLSLIVTSLATSATDTFLRWIGLEGNTAAAWVTGVLALAVALVIDMAVFVFIFWQLPERTNRERVLRASLLGALGVELLKIIGTWLVGQTTSNPVYGTFAVIVGLLIWINIMMRWMLFVAAWAVTAPFSSDVHPSGTAQTSASVPASASDVDAPRPTDDTSEATSAIPGPEASARPGSGPAPVPAAAGSTDGEADGDPGAAGRVLDRDRPGRAPASRAGQSRRNRPFWRQRWAARRRVGRSWPGR